MKPLFNITLPYFRLRNQSRWGLFFGFCIKKIVLFISVVAILLISFNVLVANSYAIVLLPVVDGHYYYYENRGCDRFRCWDDSWSYVSDGIAISYGEFYNAGGMYDDWCYYQTLGIIEFDISSFEGLFTRGHVRAELFLTLKDSSNACLYFHGMRDEYENGVIEEADIDTEDLIETTCEPLQPGDTIIINVTSLVEHDLFDPDQTEYSGFVVSRNSREVFLCEYSDIEFYDHTDSENGPRLNVVDTNSDGDDIPAVNDNCLFDYNPNQEDTYPPEGNGIGDACDCEGNFDCDQDCDGTDAATFKVDFGRSTFENPCETSNPCNGDFDCDGDCDGTDAAGFKVDFGRSSFNNPCPACVVGDWCVYP